MSNKADSRHIASKADMHNYYAVAQQTCGTDVSIWPAVRDWNGTDKCLVHDGIRNYNGQSYHQVHTYITSAQLYG